MLSKAKHLALVGPLPFNAELRYFLSMPLLTSNFKLHNNQTHNSRQEKREFLLRAPRVRLAPEIILKIINA